MQAVGPGAAPRVVMMPGHQPATAADVTRVLGDLDSLIIARILALAPTCDELDEAVQELADEAGFGEELHTPSSARVAGVRAILDELAAADDADDEAAAPVPA